MNEANFIAALRDLPLHSGARGLQDDCAIVEFGDETLIITHDMMVQGTHFRPNADMADVAWKLVASNLSDLAAKGAEPIGVLLGHSLGKDDENFLVGLKEALVAYDTPLLGGDTVAISQAHANKVRTLGLTALGRATHTPVPSRGGAKIGDHIYVTGPFGCAMLGFEGEAAHLDAFNRPTPLLAEGRELAPHTSAMMDVSDGLLLDAHRMAMASKVTIQLERALIPVVDAARFDECIRWGDDYQLLFTAHPNAAVPTTAIRIGIVSSANSAELLLDDDILSLEQGLGYQHG